MSVAKMTEESATLGALALAVGEHRVELTQYLAEVRESLAENGREVDALREQLREAVTPDEHDDHLLMRVRVSHASSDLGDLVADGLAQRTLLEHLEVEDRFLDHLQGLMGMKIQKCDRVEPETAEAQQ